MAILNAKRCSLFFLLLVVLELALVSEHIKPVQAGKKKKLLKKLKDILPLLALLKVLSQILSYFLHLLVRQSSGQSFQLKINL